MAILRIATVGHPVLREIARSVTPAELAAPDTQRFIDDMIETMRDANGAGLAANQVYRPVQICILEVNNNPRYPYKPSIPLTVLINPEIVPFSDEKFANYEGCLSVPDLRGEVLRHAEIHVRALDRTGNALDFVARGISAGTYQHEVDHLRGELFVDRVHDPKTLTTWREFDRYHREGFIERAHAIVARYGG